MNKKKFFHVVFRNVPGSYLYYSTEEINPGDLVKASFMKKEQIGLVVENVMDEEQKFKVHEAEIFLRQALNEDQLFLAAKMADYYLCHLGKVISLFFPPIFWQKIPDLLRERFIVKKTAENLRKPQRELWDKVEDDMRLEDFLAREDVTMNRVNTLLKNDAIAIREGKIIKNSQIPEPQKLPAKKLNEEQNKALEEIFNASQRKFFLFGITGSGKTEIYLQVAKRLREEGKQCLILVPEIVLTPSLVAYFANDFPNLALIHSKLAMGERVREFFRIKQGEADLILGSRLAIFSPMRDLGAVILDEEHEWTYKNDQTPCYDTRKVAEFLTQKNQAKLILASATPSIDNFYRSLKGEAQVIQLKKRALKEAKSLETMMPVVSSVDMKQEMKASNSFLLSEKLLRKMKLALAKKKSVLLFLNRRGFFSYLFCRDCGQSVKCPHCDFPLVLHTPRDRKAKLLCHYCSFNRSPVKQCDFCQGKDLHYFSAGTQNLSQEVKRFFPRAKVVRIDSDSVSRKGDFKKNLDLIRQGEADIFIGTQIIAKGFDVAKIGLVGIVLADLGLNIPDFRSSERVFSLLTQVIGRTGRGVSRGEVLIQALSPSAPAIRFAKEQSYKKFFLQEIETRQKNFFPPFSEIIKFIFTEKSKEQAFLRARNFYQELREIISKRSCKENKEEAFFAPALIPKKSNKYFFHVFLKARSLDLILPNIKIPRGARVDRDPLFLG